MKRIKTLGWPPQARKGQNRAKLGKIVVVWVDAFFVFCTLFSFLVNQGKLTIGIENFTENSYEIARNNILKNFRFLYTYRLSFSVFSTQTLEKLQNSRFWLVNHFHSNFILFFVIMNSQISYMLQCSYGSSRTCKHAIIMNLI